MVVSHESPLAGPRATLNFMRLHNAAHRCGAAAAAYYDGELRCKVFAIFLPDRARCDVPVRIAQPVVQVRASEATVRVVVEVTPRQPLIDPAGGRNIDRGLSTVIPLFRTKISARNSRDVIRGYAPLFGPTIKVSPPIHPGLHRNQARPPRGPSTQSPTRGPRPRKRGHRPRSRRGNSTTATHRPRRRPEQRPRT